MKNIRRFFAVMLSMLFLVPCAMPVVAYAETTANEDMSVIKTEAYTAVVPKNGIVVSSGPEQFTQTSRLLESTSFPNDDAIVEFDYATTLHEMYNHVLQNNMDITQAQAMDIAQSLTQKIRAANNAAISGNVKGMDYITTADGTTIIDLGRIYDGKLTLPSPYSTCRFGVVNEKQYVCFHCHCSRMPVALCFNIVLGSYNNGLFRRTIIFCKRLER